MTKFTQRDYKVQNKYWSFFYAVCFGVFVFVSGALLAQADQLVHDTASTDPELNWALGPYANLEGFITGFDLWLECRNPIGTCDAGDTINEWFMYEATSTAAVLANQVVLVASSTPGNIYTITTGDYNNPRSYSFNFQQGYQVNPSYVYVFKSGSSNAPMHLYGTADDLSSANLGKTVSQTASDDCGADCAPVEEGYIQILGLEGGGFSGDLGGIGVGPSFITINQPVNGTSTSDRSFSIDINYFLDSDYHDPDVFTHIGSSFCPQSYPDDECQKITLASSTVADTLTSLTYPITLNRDGYYLGLIYFWNGVESDVTCKWWEFWCDEQEVKVMGTASTRFNSATTTIPVDIPLSREATLSFCEDLNFFGAESICRVLIFLFFPSGDVFLKFADLDNQLADKVPFSFFFSARDELGSFVDLEGESSDNLVIDLGSFAPWGGDGTLTVIDYDALKSSTFFNSLLGEEGVLSFFIKSFVWIWVLVYVWRKFTGGREVPVTDTTTGETTYMRM